MTFQPVIPLTGNAGWSFLSRTRDAQEVAFRNSAINQRETDYFRENIGKVTSAEELVADRRLLAVALGAFGLDEDINNKFFIRKVLEEGTRDDKAFANRLSDKRYFAMAEAFRFDLSPPSTVLNSFADRTVEAYLSRQFEVAVGNTDENMRLALGLERELQGLLDRGLSETAQWFTILGTPPMRRVFEQAFNIPAQAAGIDVDRQFEMFRDASNRIFGTTSPTDFLDSEKRDGLIRRFLLQADLAGGTASFSPGAVALSLLGSQRPLF
ncbi:DUF1217 domain-containing protein [Alphaproteobacteria bacterium GH1-50]|uniref:DUF1217 domain-containing protein n=1 Tax=Kangsaoukella pontilimi TaxID=2691042 RepID=A0A7C9II71_9RHOB|nr:DUF1217 domain-containing protein [Kangsaoukella pontilimi]MXQ08182.1 DUF1217 domain-containing protein [Kangsaoukella pontilimi]